MTHGQLIGEDVELKAVSIDTRKVSADDLFIAIKGERFDAHDFVSELTGKVAGALVHKPIQSDLPQVLVKDTKQALAQLASAWRDQYKKPVIGLTGSNGKTTTKEMLASILSENFKTGKTLFNNNNHIGIPKTILETKRNTDVLVLEHGTNHFGEIKYTAEIANPDYALITNIGASHLEYLKDIEGVYHEKKALLETTLRRGGYALINCDDRLLKRKTKNLENIITFGFSGKPDVKGRILSENEYGQAKLNIKYGKKEFNFELPLYGKSNAQNVLAAIAVALKLKMPILKIKRGINNLKQVKGRLYVEKYSDMILIDDTYNANPESLKNAIELMRKIKVFKVKSVILGDMFELGRRSKEIHENIASLLIKNKIAKAYLIGKQMKNLASKLDTKIEVKHFNRRTQLKKFLISNDFSNEVVLIKGSRGMRMEEFLDDIRSKAI
jgi:UDP-N-acetylmuramoyl-tripeptide--D-alanyl-D-alanine ligase